MILTLQFSVYLIAARVIIFINGLSVTYFNCDYEDKPILSCGLPADMNETAFNNTLMKLPEDLPNSTVHLEIFCYLKNGTSIGTRLPFVLDDIDVFKRLTSLQFLLIIGSEIEIPAKLLVPEFMKILKKELFNVPSLKILAMSIAMPSLEPNITDDMQWILPENLRSFGLEKTIMNYDLRACYRLEEIFISSSQLIKPPPLHVPDPPIKRLSLIGCPLSELMVEDVARFCRLEYLSITSFDEPFNVIMNECECFKLLQWIEKLTKLGKFEFNGELPCGGITNNDELCRNNSLSKAIQLRMRCLGGNAYAILFFGVAIFMLPFVFAFSVFIRSYRRTHRKAIKKSARSTSPKSKAATKSTNSTSTKSETTLSNSSQPEKYISRVFLKN